VSGLSFGFGMFLYLAGAIIGAVYEVTTVDSGTASALVNFDILHQVEVNLLVRTFTVPVPNPAFFIGLGEAMLWNSSLWNGWASYVRLLLLLGVVSTSVLVPLVLQIYSARQSRSVI
jgi:hypothetical protein